MFTELVSEENLKRIEIDPRLVEPLRNVLKRMEKYFEEHGYTNIRDYEKLFEDMILMPPEGPRVKYDKGGGYMENGVWKRKFVFEITDEPEKDGSAAFYSGNRRKKYRLETDYERIVIGKKTMEYAPIDIEKVLCHEFIHFLVMAGINRNNTDEAIFNGGFVNEALTEMLATEIYPEGYMTYNPQVNMVRFANILTGNESNYKKFLEGKVDFRGDSSEQHTWDKFMEHASKFHEENNPDDYLQAQRFLIEHCIHYRMNSEKPMTLDEYIGLCSDITNHCPVQDKEWQDRYLSRVDKIYLEKIQGVAHDDIDKVAPSLSRIRELHARKEDLSKPVNVFNQKFMGMDFEFKRNDDDTFNIYINGNMIRENHIGFTNLSSPDFTIVMEDAKKGKIKLVDKNGQSVNVDVSNEAMRRKKDEAVRVDRELEDKKQLFKSGYLGKDLATLSLQKYDYVRVERVSIPFLTPEEKSDCAYILSLRDGSKVVLDSAGKEIELTESVQDRKISKLTGIVGKPGAYAYQLQGQGIVDKGYMGKTSDGRKVLLHIDSDGEIQLSRANDTFAFIGKKTVLYSTEKREMYNRIIPSHTPQKVDERHDGEIVNIENYKYNQGQELDEKALIDMIRGLDPKQRFSAMKFIEALSLGKDGNVHDNK